VQPQESSILNLRDSNFSFTPLDNFSVLSTRSIMQETPRFTHPTERSKNVKSTRRKSRFMPTDRTHSGIGHDGRESISSLTGIIAKRRSVGHGQDWMGGSTDQPGQGHERNSRAWLTVNSGDTNPRHRRSHASNLTYSMEFLDTRDSARMTIKQVPKSPLPPPSVRLSQSSGNSRPVSRRVGSSPFFGSSSCCNSRKLSKKVRTSYADSTTVPEESLMVGTLEDAVVHSFREESNPPRDSFGISYGSAHEGTRQLRSYIQGQLGRSRTLNQKTADSNRQAAPRSRSTSLKYSLTLRGLNKRGEGRRMNKKTTCQRNIPREVGRRNEVARVMSWNTAIKTHRSG
jgi:axial budding pattern protein 2